MENVGYLTLNSTGSFGFNSISVIQTLDCFSSHTGINHCANSQCSHICVLKRNGSSCLCPISMKLDPENPNLCKGIMNLYILNKFTRSDVKYVRQCEQVSVTLTAENI